LRIGQREIVASAAVDGGEQARERSVQRRRHARAAARARHRAVERVVLETLAALEVLSIEVRKSGRARRLWSIEASMRTGTWWPSPCATSNASRMVSRISPAPGSAVEHLTDRPPRDRRDRVEGGVRGKLVPHDVMDPGRQAVLDVRVLEPRGEALCAR